MGNSLEYLGHNNIVKIEKRIINGEKIDVPVAVGENGFTKFTVDDGLYNLALNGRETEQSQGKYKVAFEAFAHPIKEEKSLLIGRYIGTVQHICLNGVKTSDGATYGDTVFWENNVFKSVNKKEYDEFVHSKPIVDSKILLQS